MNSRIDQLTQTLTLFIPTYTHTTLPKQLTSLAQSYLQKSRSKAPHLKPQEEIARTHCVCDIAVKVFERRHQKITPSARTGNKTSKGKVGPPCGNKVYKRLYGYLEGLLVMKDGEGGDLSNGGKREGIPRRRALLTPSSSSSKDMPSSTGKRKRNVEEVGNDESPCSRAEKRARRDFDTQDVERVRQYRKGTQALKKNESGLISPSSSPDKQQDKENDPTKQPIVKVKSLKLQSLKTANPTTNSTTTKESNHTHNLNQEIPTKIQDPETLPGEDISEDHDSSFNNEDDDDDDEEDEITIPQKNTHANTNTNTNPIPLMQERFFNYLSPEMKTEFKRWKRDVLRRCLDGERKEGSLGRAR